MKAIDLAQSSEGMCCPAPSEPNSVHYPSLYIDLKGAELDDLPESGTMTVRYKVCSRNSSERNGKKTSGVSIDVKEILSAEGDKTPGKSRGDELDALAKEVADSEDSEDEGDE